MHCLLVPRSQMLPRFLPFSRFSRTLSNRPHSRVSNSVLIGTVCLGDSGREAHSNCIRGMEQRRKTRSWYVCFATEEESCIWIWSLSFIQSVSHCVWSAPMRISLFRGLLQVRFCCLNASFRLFLGRWSTGGSRFSWKMFTRMDDHINVVLLVLPNRIVIYNESYIKLLYH